MSNHRIEDSVMIHIRIPKTLYERLVATKNSMAMTPSLTSLVRGLVEAGLAAQARAPRTRA
jgi:hypothetical protein